MAGAGRSTEVSVVVDAPAGRVYAAFVDPEAVVRWLPPGSMTGTIHRFEPREGGAFSMSLRYTQRDGRPEGKSDADTDTVEGTFARLVPDRLVVWETRFAATDPAYAGKMTITTTLEPLGERTRVTMRCDGIPDGVLLEDNEAGTRESLENLAGYLAGRKA